MARLSPDPTRPYRMRRMAIFVDAVDRRGEDRYGDTPMALALDAQTMRPANRTTVCNGLQRVGGLPAELLFTNLFTKEF